MGENKLLSDLQVQAEYGIPRATLRKWRLFGGGPRWRKISGKVGRPGGCVRYRRADVELFIDQAPGGGGPAAQSENPQPPAAA